MADTAERTYTFDEVSAALNRAVDDIADAAALPDEGTRDALNLAVNVTLTYLATDSATLHDAADDYDGDLDEILGWIRS